ncbi:ABC transporter substrate-binding protein [Marispirochaeta sp.]|uniref:substrate-binding periplasmic protein n=1 Tax=Marispirochaeta sp. TaxID=2038653 RepID=UPI0029C68ABD|nr:ABC transporter substrate-binding protein [Marispirochaeta sp.]
MFTVFRTPEREDLYKWVGPIDSGSIFFYKRADNPLTINSIEDARNVDIIACRYAGLIPDLLRSMGFTNLETTATDSIQIYTKLLLGRCDLGISDTDLGVIYYLKEIGVPTNALTKIPVKVFEAELYIACSKDMPDSVVSDWQNTLEIFRNSEKYKEIRNKYYH